MGAVARSVRVAVRPLMEGEVALDAGASHYLIRVHRLRRGARFVAFDPLSATEADGVLLDEQPNKARCRLSALRPARLAGRLGATLIQSIGKADKLDQVVRDATALGVECIVVVETERAVVRLGQRSAARLERWKKIAVEAARQSGRGDLPEIRGPLRLELALAECTALFKICLDPASDQVLGGVLENWTAPEPIALLVGPEGGFSDSELELAARSGFCKARFGRFVLRTETVAAAVLGTLVARADLELPSAAHGEER